MRMRLCGLLLSSWMGIGAGCGDAEDGTSSSLGSGGAAECPSAASVNEAVGLRLSLTAEQFDEQEQWLLCEYMGDGLVTIQLHGDGDADSFADDRSFWAERDDLQAVEGLGVDAFASVDAGGDGYAEHTMLYVLGRDIRFSLIVTAGLEPTTRLARELLK